MSAQVETWRVSTPEGVFETDLETLKQWIGEGCVLPTDKVSKGNLSWIEAGRAPMLRATFAGEIPTANPAVASGVNSTSTMDASSSHESVQPAAMPVKSSTVPSAANVCHNHPQIASKFVCRACSNAFCDQCPKFFGTSKVPLCPLCGDLCSLVGKLQHQAARQELQNSGFGLGDFARAFGHYERSRITRTARVVLSAREMGRIFHAKGVERLVRNDLWKGRTPERYYDALEWLYGWRVENCLAA